MTLRRCVLRAAFVAAALAVLATLLGTPAAASTSDGGWVDTRFGPLGPADRDLVTKVRLAGLWEMPAGNMAAEKGNSARVRQIGAEIAEQHAELDKLVRDAAAKLDLAIPDQPNAAQQGWLAQLGAAEGEAFDQVFVDRLRAAHGVVFAEIAVVRAGTRNDVVRELAQQANDFVLNHLTLLESTGLVGYADLPPPPDPPAGSGGTTAFSWSSWTATGRVPPVVVVLVALTAFGAAAAATVRLVRPR